MRETVLDWIKKEKIIAIVRGAEPEQCQAVAKALYEGGIRLMEITYDQKNPGGWQKTADAIGQLAKEYEGRMFVGAGTVTNVELVEMTAKAAIYTTVTQEQSPSIPSVRFTAFTM